MRLFSFLGRCCCCCCLPFLFCTTLRSSNTNLYIYIYILSIWQTPSRRICVEHIEYIYWREEKWCFSHQETVKLLRVSQTNTHTRKTAAATIPISLLPFFTYRLNFSFSLHFFVCIFYSFHLNVFIRLSTHTTTTSICISHSQNNELAKKVRKKKWEIHKKITLKKKNDIVIVYRGRKLYYLDLHRHKRTHTRARAYNG